MWFGRLERPISSMSLVLGFVFDAVTLKRVDTFWETCWILSHLIIVGLFIALIHIHEKKTDDDRNPRKAHFWYVNILQFVFGGLLSTYLVFYFRSADFFVTWPFVLLLALAFIANESLKRHYIRFSFQISLYFLSIYSFAIYLVPVVLHKIGLQVFLLSGLLSLAFVCFFILILSPFMKTEIVESKKLISTLILGSFALVNILYFTNLIPPIPLSLKDAGMYHSIQKTEDGNYTVTHEDSGRGGYFKLYPPFRETSGSPVYAYSAIFSPTDLNITIGHEWQHYEEEQNEWVTEGVISLPVVGGRDGGFRTYSGRSGLASGKWRVNIKTEQNKTIGHIRFKIVPVDTEPALVTTVKR
jgi:hypothetical protein